MARLVAYLRVSTDRQADAGHGLEVQLEAIRAWARANRHRIVAVCRDEGRSGAADAINRPGLADTLAYLKQGQAAGVVVYRLDRLARDLILQERLNREIADLGGQLRSTSPTEDRYLIDDPDDPSGKLIRRIVGAIAEYEREMIALRMRAGKARKLAGGGYAHGRPPYGYRAHRGELVADVGEHRVMARMRRLRRRGLSLRQIVAELHKEGIPTRSGRPWTPQGVARVLAATPRRSTHARESYPGTTRRAAGEGGEGG